MKAQIVKKNIDYLANVHATAEVTRIRALRTRFASRAVQTDVAGIKTTLPSDDARLREEGESRELEHYFKLARLASWRTSASAASTSGRQSSTTTTMSPTTTAPAPGDLYDPYRDPTPSTSSRRTNRRAFHRRR